MEIPENENELHTYEPKIETNDDGIDEIEIYSTLSCGYIISWIILTIMFLWCPCICYMLLKNSGCRNVAAIDKKSKTLILGKRGFVISCCLFQRKTYFLKEIKNVKIQVISKDDPKVGFGKLHFINGYIYSQKDECQTLFSYIEYTDEKYNEFVSFFKKYIHTIEEPLEKVKSKHKALSIHSNDIENKPYSNEDAALPAAS